MFKTIDLPTLRRTRDVVENRLQQAKDRLAAVSKLKNQYHQKLSAKNNIDRLTQSLLIVNSEIEKLEN